MVDGIYYTEGHKRRVNNLVQQKARKKIKKYIVLVAIVAALWLYVSTAQFRALENSQWQGESICWLPCYTYTVI